MNGRMENENKIAKSTEAKLAQMPDYVRGWYLNLQSSSNTASTCYDWITKVYNFLRTIDENVKNVKATDINDITVSSYMMSIRTKTTKAGAVVETSGSYQRTVWCCLHRFFGYLKETGLIPRNYMDLIKPSRKQDLERINKNRVQLTASDFKKILKAADKERNPIRRKRNVAILMTFMSTGVRRTALTNIKVGDIDLNKKTLFVVDKRDKDHTYVLNDDAINSIKEWEAVRPAFVKGDDNGYLFLSDHGAKIGGSTVMDIVKKYTEKALGHAVSPHKLRSGYCTILYNKTHDIEFVRRAVGHSNVSTTQRYIVTKGEDAKQAAEIMGEII